MALQRVARQSDLQRSVPGPQMLAAGACAIAAGLWRSGSGNSWLISLHGLALGVFGLIGVIDSAGATIDFLLSAFHDADAAKRLFRKALSHPSHLQPRVINTDLAPIYGSATPGER